MKPIATDNYDFERLIKDGYAYVDKTDMLWKLANGRNGTLFFISRPRRFGKSLMLSTFKYLFQGRKDLFKGLKIEKKKWDWSKTGVPTLILERLQASNMKPDAIDDVHVRMEDLDVCDVEELPWKSLLYQSGYLTIKKVHWTEKGGHHVEGLTLGMPNREVRESLKSLWWRQLMKIDEKDFVALVDVAKRQVADGDVRMLVGKTLYSLYASLPPTWRVKNEADAKRHFHLFMKMLGANVQAEEPSAFGYVDAIVETKKAVYVFEFKFNKSAKAAIRQIREKGYADAYKVGKRPVTLIGINFSSKKRNIDEPLMESL